MPSTLVHLGFDVLATGSSAVVTWLIFQWRLKDRVRLIEQGGVGYAFALLMGAALGGYALGSFNLLLSARPGIGRSIIGALLGAIVAVELFKHTKGIRGSTGLIFVPAFCTAVMIGRIGCFLSGLDDFTYGISTTVPWGHDFGDGMLRHPVQLYEIAAMASFFAITLIALRSRAPFFLRNGFYLMTGWYALQRYVWESYKPYDTVFAGQNVFHLAAVILVGYAITMIWRTEHARHQLA